jgi:FMN-dependent dehydrogenase
MSSQPNRFTKLHSGACRCLQNTRRNRKRRDIGGLVDENDGPQTRVVVRRDIADQACSVATLARSVDVGAMRADEFIKSPKEAINVFDFELVCRKNVPLVHFGYMASGIDNEVTLRANREGFLKFQLRPRRLVDVSKVLHLRASRTALSS